MVAKPTLPCYTGIHNCRADKLTIDPPRLPKFDIEHGRFVNGVNKINETKEAERIV